MRPEELLYFLDEGSCGLSNDLWVKDNASVITLIVILWLRL
jgi:hypothetical protein